MVTKTIPAIDLTRRLVLIYLMFIILHLAFQVIKKRSLLLVFLVHKLEIYVWVEPTVNARAVYKSAHRISLFKKQFSNCALALVIS